MYIMTVIETQQAKVDALIAALPDDEQSIYREIAEYAVALGYSPAKTKDIHEPVIFAKNIKSYGYRRMCRISPPNALVGNVQKTAFALSFYAMSDYSEIFHESVRNACESRKKINVVPGYSEIFSCENKKSSCRFRKDSCDKCRKCKDYFYTYPCGKTISCDHIYLIDILPITMAYVGEIKSMMKRQHECWTYHL